jgi:hypothetical protein
MKWNVGPGRDGRQRLFLRTLLVPSAGIMPSFAVGSKRFLLVSVSRRTAGEILVKARHPVVGLGCVVLGIKRQSKALRAEDDRAFGLVSLLPVLPERRD